jgi:hypothetical protein
MAVDRRHIGLQHVARAPVRLGIAGRRLWERPRRQAVEAGANPASIPIEDLNAENDE